VLSHERWDRIKEWKKQSLPLKALSVDDRYRFVAALIATINDYEDGNDNLLDPLAKWLVEQGVTNVDRIKSWTSDLRMWPDYPEIEEYRRASLCADLRKQIKACLLDLERPRPSRA
jgi:hypothetical protein